MTTLHVACAVEGAYVAHSAAMLHSVAARSGELDVHAHFLHGPGLPADPVRRIEAMLRRMGAKMTAYEIAPERVAGLPVVAEFTVAMWYRILLAELLADADRVLYLDVDTLAVGDLGALWATDLDGHHLAAVTNVLMPEHAHRPASLGLSPAAYFNSGVLLMNLERMRESGSTAALHSFATERGPELEWPDQDTLNVVLGEDRLPLHPRWNAMNSLRFDWALDVFDAETLAEARRAPGIRHFEGPDDNKPWHPDCEQPDRERYFAHRSQTPWPGRRLAAEISLRRAGRAARRWAAALRSG